MNKAINSPFRYAGGKFYARKLIIEQIPLHSIYIEPFAGGASIFFAKSKVQENWLNDLDRELINTYLFIKNEPELLIQSLAGIEAKKELHFFYKNEFQPKNPLERAKRWYYLNRTSYSGIMNMKNCYWGYGEKYSMRPENWGRNIRRTSEKLKNVKITNWDFEKVIEKAPNNSFLFLDPPYYNADQDKFYTHSFVLDDHIRLCSLLKKHSNRIKFLLTYDNSPEVISLYKWTENHLEREWNYTISRTDDQKKKSNSQQRNKKGTRYKGKEIFITNYSMSTSEQLQLAF